MKLVLNSPAAVRNAARERQKRERAAAPVLRTLFPGLATLQLEFEFSDNTEFLPSPQVAVMHPPARAYFRFACPYSDCDGEFDLAGPINLLVNAQQPRERGQLRCTGTRHGGAQCTLNLEYAISAQRE
jgi:hypothetical protein